MRDPDRIVAVSFLNERELTTVGQMLSLVYAVNRTADFDELIRAIDVADAKVSISPKLRQS